MEIALIVSTIWNVLSDVFPNVVSTIMMIIIIIIIIIIIFFLIFSCFAAEDFISFFVFKTNTSA